MSTTFKEFHPAKPLLPYIQSYWLGDFNINAGRDFSRSVLPNGCIELIIHLTDYHCSLYKPESNWSDSPAFTLIGLFNKPYYVHFPHYVKVFGIRFYPDGLRNIFGIAPAEFLSTYEDGVAVLGKSLHEFCCGIRTLNSPQHQVELANTFLTRRRASRVKRYDYTHTAMEIIRSVQGISDYQQVTDQVPISRRQLQREFKSLYGMTIKDYMRLTRMNAIHRYMHSTQTGLTQLPYELNFTDQSHFIREFKHYVGMAPKKFTKNREQFIVNPVHGAVHHEI